MGNIIYLKKKAKILLKEFAKYGCVSIYLGGSLVEKHIEHPHDVDFICFSEKQNQIGLLRERIHAWTEKHKDELVTDSDDFYQVRSFEYEEHAYGSYINKQMIYLCGKKHKFTFDVINKDREEYIQILKEAKYKLENRKIMNQKRWYQLLRGIYILENNSYKLNKKQKQNLNILHDQLTNHPDYYNLIEECKNKIDNL